MEEGAEDMRSSDEIRDMIMPYSLCDCEWLRRLDALEQGGVVSRVGATPRSRWRDVIKLIAEVLELEEDQRKSLNDAVREAAKKSSESRVASSDDAAPDEADSIAQMLVAMGLRDDLFHDGAGTAYASIDHAEHGVETIITGSGRHEEILALRLWREHATTASSSSLGDAVRTLRAMAKAEGDRRDVYLRHHYNLESETIWYDLADERRRAVAITSTGWTIVDRPSVHFARYRNTIAQVAPVEGGSLELLRALCNVEDERHWALFVGWLVQAITPNMPRYGMMLGGGQGSAKSTTAKLGRSVVDPAMALTTALPKNEDDFAVVASTNAILAADNVSAMSRNLSDMLCAAITGDGYARRTKYRDRDETVWKFQLPVLLNGIGNVLKWPDLLDRMLLVRCPKIRPGCRRKERQIWADYRRDAPAILGGLFDLASGVLAHLNAVEVPGDIRMADAAQVMVAAGHTLGWPKERMLDALRGNAAEQVREAIEESIIAQPLLDLLEKTGGTEGTMGTVLQQLNASTSETLTRERAWPKSPRALRAALDRIDPALAKLGWIVGSERTPGCDGRERIVWIERSSAEVSEETPSPPSPPSPATSESRPTVDRVEGAL